MDYRHGAHTVFMVHLHFVGVTKYRKPVLTGEVGLRVRELIRQVCREQEVESLKGHGGRGPGPRPPLRVEPAAGHD